MFFEFPRPPFSGGGSSSSSSRFGFVHFGFLNDVGQLGLPFLDNGFHLFVLFWVFLNGKKGGEGIVHFIDQETQQNASVYGVVVLEMVREKELKVHRKSEIEQDVGYDLVRLASKVRWDSA